MGSSIDAPSIPIGEPVPEEQEQEQEPGQGPTPDHRTLFRAALWAARAILLGQLAWMMGFSTVVYERGGLTYDFSAFYQPAWLIAHGHLNPADDAQFMSFWKANGNWIMWPLAELTRLPPHGLWLPWAQDLAVFGCGWVALHWIARLAGSESWRSRLWPWVAVLLVVVLFAGNPWTYSSAGYDFHFEEIATFFLLMAAWDLSRGRTRRVWIWVVLALLSHVVSALVVIGVGLAGLVWLRTASGQPQTEPPLEHRTALRRTCLYMTGAGAAWFALMLMIHSDQASPFVQGYGYLAGPGVRHPSDLQMALGALRHPSRPLGQLWSNRDNVWANLSPAGLIGVLNPWGFFAAASVLGPGLLFHGHAFAEPQFQNFGTYPFVAVGSVLVLRRVGAMRGWAAHAVRPAPLVLAALTVGWAWAYLPSYGQQFLQVSPSGSRALASARRLIPGNAPVVASDLVAGRFAGRDRIYVLIGFPERIPLDGQTTYFVVSTKPVYRARDTDAFIGQLTAMGSQLEYEDNGIWVFRWTPPSGMRSILILGQSGGVPGWALTPAEASVVTAGPPLTWAIRGSGAPGLVAKGNWGQGPGRYVATVVLATSGPAQIQVKVAQTGQLLATRTVAPAAAGQRQSFAVPFTQSAALPYLPGKSGLHGRGIFKIFRVQGAGTSPTQVAQVRVVNPGRSVISVYSVAVQPSSA